ncbi:MAG: anthranilate synthase component I [Alphaproteobacteria bacterium]|nr:anthranilate synthase component I [Alphaproteobacteria bacterium]
MRINPALSDFTDTYDNGRPQVVWTKLVADLETPVSAMQKLARNAPNSFLLESVEGGAMRGRYSFIGIRPDVIWRCFGDRAEINENASHDANAFVPAAGGAFRSFRELLAKSAVDLPDALPPMAAGLVGYMGYDMVRLMEGLPASNPEGVTGMPDGMFVRATVMAIFDNIEDTAILVTPVRPKEGVDAKTAYGKAQARLEQCIADLDTRLPPEAAPSTPGTPPEPVSNMAREAYYGMVERAKEYILAGDIFQVVPSQRFQVPFTLPPIALYRALRRLNPSPFLFLLDFEGFAVVGSSPEIMVRVRDGVVTIRPIAGTRRRGKDAAEDKRLAEDLLADPKERAEHLMLLDLGRNDVGRVADIGSVEVTEEMNVEYYSHVMHLVSNVQGRLDPKFDAIDALIAGFPAGTVSGAPKVRAMEIIEELEPDRRGIYGGCVGYFASNGTMDSCIALRTAIVKDGKMYVQAGGGVVADSKPEAEYQESCNKAMALIRAAEEAMRYASNE